MEGPSANMALPCNPGGSLGQITTQSQKLFLCCFLLFLLFLVVFRKTTKTTKNNFSKNENSQKKICDSSLCIKSEESMRSQTKSHVFDVFANFQEKKRILIKHNFHTQNHMVLINYLTVTVVKKNVF